MKTMNRKIAGIMAEAGKKTALYNSKKTMFWWFSEPKMPRSLIQKQK